MSQMVEVERQTEWGGLVSVLRSDHQEVQKAECTGEGKCHQGPHNPVAENEEGRSWQLSCRGQGEKVLAAQLQRSRSKGPCRTTSRVLFIMMSFV